MTGQPRPSPTREQDAALATRHAPVLRFDQLEPFLPNALGYTFHDSDGQAASAGHHQVSLKGAARAIEFAIWWDWDIQHLYELEHVWVYLDEKDEVCRVEASAHGSVGQLWLWDRTLPVQNGRVTLFSEPGKHAFAPDSERLRANFAITTLCCGERAGAGTILIADLLDGALDDLKPYDHHVARRFLRARAFRPTFRFDREFDLRSVDLMPWPELKASIPGRVRGELTRLRNAAQGVKAVFLDSGDTLIDERTEIRVDGEVVLQAGPVPGGDRLVASLKERGYLVALVADGLVESFENVHKAMGFWELFDAYAISEAVGAAKPDRRMFDTAIQALGLNEEDHAGCVMVGNNLARDIAGANQLGLTSVWLNWTTRYPTDPANADEVPDHTIRLPHQLLDLLDEIDAAAS